MSQPLESHNIHYDSLLSVLKDCPLPGTEFEARHDTPVILALRRLKEEELELKAWAAQ